jgi:preprotein translocase SecE subunit
MARNRQRAKDRKQRQRQDPDSGSGPVDDGADEIVDPELAGGAPPDDLGTVPPRVDYDDEPDDDDGDIGDEVDLGPGAGDVAAPAKPKGFRFVTFLRACWAELQRVQWPDRRQVGQATAVVLGFVVIAGAFLGLADVVAQRIVNLIL